MSAPADPPHCTACGAVIDGRTDRRTVICYQTADFRHVYPDGTSADPFVRPSSGEAPAAPAADNQDVPPPEPVVAP